MRHLAKTFCNFFVTLLLFFSLQALGQEFALLLPEDLLKKGPLSLDKMSAQEIRETVLKRYVMVADFFESDQPEIPKGWPDPKKDKAFFLSLGKPNILKRPNLEIEVPLFILPEINYFRGEGEHFQQINSAITYWKDKNYQSAFDTLFPLADLLKEQASATSARMVTYALLGFFHLEMAKSEIKGVRYPGKKEYGPELGVNDHLERATTNFARVHHKLDPVTIHALAQQKLDEDLYSKLFLYPQYPQGKVSLVGKEYVTLLKPYPSDPLRWVRSVTPFVMWNAAIQAMQHEMYEDMFYISEGLESFSKDSKGDKLRLKPQYATNFAKLPKHGRLKQKLKMELKNEKDFTASLHALKALLLLTHADPLLLLEEIDKTIRSAHSSDIQSFAFLMSGIFFSDIHMERMARQHFAWSEAVDPSFAKKYPYAYFFGAENAFWMGNRAVARSGFERFLQSAGDPEWGPWARLRLAEILHADRKFGVVEHRYHEITRSFPDHLAAQDATVRLFCNINKELGPNGLKKAYDEVLVKIKDARTDLKSQAKACLLSSDLEGFTKKSSPLPQEAKKDAEVQLSAIKTYENEFPQSEYIELFKNRERDLKGALAVTLASQNKCNELLNVYKKDPQLLEKFTETSPYLKSLQWKKEDKFILNRCAALAKDWEIWKTMLVKTNDETVLQKKLFQYLQNPLERHAVELFHSIRLSLIEDEWQKVALELEKIDWVSFVRAKNFWQQISIFELVVYEMKNKKSPRYQAQMKGVLTQKAKQTLKSKTLCRWMLGASTLMVAKDWDRVLLALPSEDWVEYLSVDLTQEEWEEPLDQCRYQVAKHLWKQSMQNMTPKREKHLVLPFLIAGGKDKLSEEWLDYIQKIEKKTSASHPDVLRYYKELAKETKNPTIKAAVEAWLEKNAALIQPLL